MKILVLNSGSSSIKYRVFSMPGEKTEAMGALERIGSGESLLTHESPNGKTQSRCTAKNHGQGLEIIAGILTDADRGIIASLSEISAVGHRVVHGGESFSGSTIVNSNVIKAIKENIPLAPLHNPPNLEGIKAVSDIMEKTAQVAVFDTAFHQTMPPEAYMYALPRRMYEKLHVRRYGFHGTSHRFAADRTARLEGRPAWNINMITCHLGNGCSMAAIRGGKSVDTSMGMTPLEGLVMGTRPGDIDPGVIFFLAEQAGMELKEIKTLLNNKSGLLGISGASNDMRDIESLAKSGDKKAGLAIGLFCYRVKKYIGAYTAVLGRVDAVTFTGGIGENSPEIRNRICKNMRPLGIVLDGRRNRSAAGREKLISGPSSRVKVYVVPANEELMIARDVYRIVPG